jgi:hypothetical protein
MSLAVVLDKPSTIGENMLITTNRRRRAAFRVRPNFQVRDKPGLRFNLSLLSYVTYSLTVLSKKRQIPDLTVDDAVLAEISSTQCHHLIAWLEAQETFLSIVPYLANTSY